jgi:hypothetical protein
LFLKKLKNFSFTGLNLEVKSFLEKNKMYSHTMEIVSPDNIVLSKKQYKKNLKQISKNYKDNLLFCKNYIQLFDLHGEICLTKIFHQ